MLSLTACSSCPDPASQEIPADPYLSQPEFVNVKALSELPEEGYYLSVEDAKMLSANVAKLKAHIEKLKVRIDPEYEPMLE